jgi:geranylgeranyl pyrophosphate synthase
VIAAGGSESTLDALTLWAEHAGVAFQIADDVLDEVSTAQALGKTPGKDSEANKTTAIALWGVEKAKERALTLAGNAASDVAGIQGADFFQALARFLVQRLS